MLSAWPWGNDHEKAREWVINPLLAAAAAVVCRCARTGSRWDRLKETQMNNREDARTLPA